MSKRVSFKLLTPAEVSTMYEKCVEFLSKKGGIKVENHPQALKMLAKAGANVDFDKEIVRYPKDIIESALKTVPKSFTLAGRDKKFDLPLPHPEGLFHVRSVTGVLYYLDPDDNEYKPTTIDFVKEWAQLIQVLDNINICLYPTPRDVPEMVADVRGLRALLENTSKHITIQPFGPNSVKYLIQQAQAAAGGAEALKKRPIISVLSAPMVPFAIKDMDIEVIIQCSKAGVPISANPLPNMGGTSPMTIAATAIQSGIEILNVVVMSQLFTPGAPVIGQPNFYTIDMATGRTLCANVESHLGAAASAQFIKDAFGIPTWTWGIGTDSYIPNGQSAIEKTLGALLVSGVGCDILAGAGFLDVGKACSSVQLIIDDTMVKIVKRALKGVEVNEDTMAFNELVSTPPGGNYLEREHTLKHCRDIVPVKLFASHSYDSWRADGGKNLHDRALDKYRELKKQLKPAGLPAEVIKQLDNIVKQADKDLINKATVKKAKIQTRR